MISYKIISLLSHLCQYIMEKNVFSIFFIEMPCFYNKFYIANAMSVCYTIYSIEYSNIIIRRFFHEA